MQPRLHTVAAQATYGCSLYARLMVSEYDLELTPGTALHTRWGGVGWGEGEVG